MAAPAIAQDSGPSPAPEADDVVIVIGQTIEETLPQELAALGSDIAVISSEEIRDKIFVDVSQALQMSTPGLFLAPRGGPFSYLDISLQGSRTQDMLFLVDGVRVNNRLYAGTITDTLPAAMVERVEVLKGGQSLFYGTQAAAGVINVVTRGYTDELDGQVSIGADTNDGTHFDAYVRGKFGPGNVVLYGSQDKADGFETFTAFQPSATDRTRGYDVDTIGAKYRLEFTDTLSLDARYQHTDAALDYPGARLTAFSENVRDEDIASAALDYSPSDQLQFLVKGYYHWWDSEYTTINNSLTTPGQLDVVDLNTFWGYEDKGINALGKFDPGGGFEFLAGYDYQQYSGRDDVLLIDAQDEEVHAVFGQIRTTDDLIENGAFAIGVRYNDTGGTTKTVWNATGRYEFSDYLYVQGNIGTSFLLPTAEQLYAVDPCCALGNPDLEAEESESLNVSVGGMVEPGPILQWQATYFARDIDNLISDDSFAALGLDPNVLYPNLMDPVPATPENELFENGLYYNLPGKVEVRGFEVMGAADFRNGVSANISYTNNESEQAGTGQQIARIPKEYVKAGVTYDAASGRWGVGANLLYTGEQRQNVNGFGNVNYGEYTVVDLSGHVYLDDEQSHKLTARLENAFDEDYITRPNSALVDNTTTGERFFFGARGVPQTLRVTYTYDF